MTRPGSGRTGTGEGSTRLGQAPRAAVARQKVGEGRVEQTMPFVFSGDETADVGYDSGTPVTGDYDRDTSTFTGKINCVQVDLGKDDHDHFIEPEERVRLAMARQ